MAENDRNISQLTALTGEGINRTNDQVAVWDDDADTTKRVAAQDFVTTGLQDPTGATTTRVNKVVALDQTAYDGIGTPDSETLYVITDGRTEMEALADYFRANPSAVFADFVTYVTTTYPAA
jgi:hypothetical protein